jgi:hypothetical protein
MSTALAGFLKDITNTFKVPLSLSFLIFLICVFLFLFLKKRLRIYFQLYQSLLF